MISLNNSLIPSPVDPVVGIIGISKNSDTEIPSYSKQLVKSPHGYVINGPKAIFGGFIGDCASDENFPYYWECQAENGGESFH